jgi:hypothetical protein
MLTRTRTLEASGRSRTGGSVALLASVLLLFFLPCGIITRWVHNLNRTFSARVNY